MKTLLTLLSFVILHSAFVIAGDPSTNVTFTDAKGTWTCKGQKWKGQVHKYVEGRIFVTGDVTGYTGTWLKAEDLDPATRGWLGIGTDSDDEAFIVHNAQAQQQDEATRQRQLAALIAADEAAKARLFLLQRQRDEARADKAADAATKQRNYENYLAYLQTQAWIRFASHR